MLKPLTIVPELGSKAEEDSEEEPRGPYGDDDGHENGKDVEDSTSEDTAVEEDD